MHFFSRRRGWPELSKIVDTARDRMVGEDGEQRADGREEQPEGALVERVRAYPPNARIHWQIAKKSCEDERLKDGAPLQHERASVGRLRYLEITSQWLAVRVCGACMANFESATA